MNKRLTDKELTYINSLGYTIRSKYIGPVEGIEYRVAKIGEEKILVYRKSERAAYNFILKTSKGN